MGLKLKYETGVAASIQFVIVTVMNFIDGVSGSIHQCTSNRSSCTSNIVLALIYFVVISVCFGILMLAGFAAQDRRSKRISQLLIIGEVLVLLISLYGLTHQNYSLIGRINSLVDGITALWVSALAFKLMRAKGGRIRPRHRIHHSNDTPQS